VYDAYHASSDGGRKLVPLANGRECLRGQVVWEEEKERIDPLGLAISREEFFI
jgi:hypothetical protein